MQTPALSLPISLQTPPCLQPFWTSEHSSRQKPPMHWESMAHCTEAVQAVPALLQGLQPSQRPSCSL